MITKENINKSVVDSVLIESGSYAGEYKVGEVDHQEHLIFINIELKEGDTRHLAVEEGRYYKHLEKVRNKKISNLLD